MSIQINRFYMVQVFGFGQGQMDFLCKNSMGFDAVLEFISNNFPGIGIVKAIDFDGDSIQPKCEYLDFVDGNTIVMDGKVEITRQLVKELDCLDDVMDFNPQYAQGYQMLQRCNAILWTHNPISVGKDMVWMTIR